MSVRRHTAIVTEGKAKPIIRLSDKSEKITVRCSNDLKRAVTIAALDRKISIEALCVELIAAGLDLQLDRDKAEAA
jgi:hypothetical protein